MLFQENKFLSFTSYCFKICHKYIFLLQIHFLMWIVSSSIIDNIWYVYIFQLRFYPQIDHYHKISALDATNPEIFDHLYSSQEDQKRERKGNKRRATKEKEIVVLLVVDILQIGINCNNTCNWYKMMKQFFTP